MQSAVHYVWHFFSV